MVIKKHESLSEFDAWSGAADTMEALTKAYDNGKLDWDSLEYQIEEVLCDDEGGVYETTLNDFLRFETDTIANMLGYEDWDDFCRKAVELKDDEEEEEEDDEL